MASFRRAVIDRQNQGSVRPVLAQQQHVAPEQSKDQRANLLGRPVAPALHQVSFTTAQKAGGFNGQP